MQRKECIDDQAHSLGDWLFKIGLPMFIEDLRAAEIYSIEEVYSLSQEDFLSIGVYDDKHIRLLLEKVKFYINTTSL